MSKRGFLIAFLLLSFVGVSAQNNNNYFKNYLEVVGRAEKEYTPDQIFTQIVVSELNSRGKKSLDNIEKELFKMLTAIGVDLKEDLQVSDMHSTLEKYLLKRDNIAATREYIVTVKNSKELAQLFEAATKLEITDITVTHAKLSNPQEIGRVLLQEAAKDAQLNAEAIAAGLGLKLDQVISVQSYSVSPGQLYLNAPMLMTRSKEVAAADNVTPVIPDFKKIKVSHQITIRFSLK
ncbi:MAG: SIMPL domain-containing protein [Bacteroidales bacterium]